MDDILIVLLTALLPTLTNARNIPYVPAVVYPPTPQEGKYEQPHDTKGVMTAFWKSQWSLYVPHSGHYMYRQFNIQQFHVLPTQCIYVLCGSENKQRLFPYTALTDWFV